MSTAFVGRAAELESLARVARARLDGEVAVAVVTGEPGSGKSRLIDELCRRVGGGDVVRAAGFEAEEIVPLAAASPLLRFLVASGRAGAHLDGLIFAGEADSDSLDPFRVFEASFRAVCSRPPLLLVVDDLQWVDPLSVALCHYLLRASVDARHGLSVIAAARPSARSSALAGSFDAEIVDLAGLGRSEGVTLARGVAPELSDADATEIWHRAQGSPFWVEALARAGERDADASRFVQARLLGASPEAAVLLGLLSAAARPLTVDDIAELEHWTGGRAAAAVKELSSRGLAGDGAGSVRPAHDLIREAALADLPADTVHRLHSRLAAWLEERAAGNLQLQLEALRHRQLAELPTTELGLRIVSSPRRRLLGDDGLAKLALLADELGLAEPGFLELHTEVAALAAELADYEQARARWLLVARHSQEPRLRAEALLSAARAAVELARVEEARSLVDSATALGVEDDVLTLELLTLRTDVSVWLGQQDERESIEGFALAREADRRAAALVAAAGGVRSLDRRSLQAYEAALGVVTYARWLSGDRLGRARAAEAQLAAASVLDEESYLRARLDLALLNEDLDDIRDVRDIALRRVLPKVALHAGAMLVQRLLGFGRLYEAASAAAEIAPLSDRVPDLGRGRQRLSYFQALVDLYCGSWSEGLASLLQQAERDPQPWRRYGCYVEHAHWLARMFGRARADEALASLTAARELSERHDFSLGRATTQLGLAEVLARVGRTEEARAALALVDTKATPRFPWENGRARVIEALLDPDRAAAASRLETIRNDTAKLGLALEVVWTELDVGRALLEVDRRRAADAFREAAEHGGELGAVTLVELAERELRALGVRTWRRGSAPSDIDGAGLTDRERQVVLLAAEGSTNPEIAEQLFLSRKTIERHISNALAKLGVRNRTELAARFGEALRSPPSG